MKKKNSLFIGKSFRCKIIALLLLSVFICNNTTDAQSSCVFVDLDFVAGQEINPVCGTFDLEYTLLGSQSCSTNEYKFSLNFRKDIFELINPIGFTVDNSDPLWIVYTKNVFTQVAIPFVEQYKFRIIDPDLTGSYGASGSIYSNTQNVLEQLNVTEFEQIVPNSRYVPDGSTITSLLADGTLSTFLDCDEQTTDLVIGGELFIDQDWCTGFTNLAGDLSKYKIHMTENSRIIVQSGVQYDLSFAEVTACGGPWGTIIVEPGGVLIVNESILDNAQTAITVQPGGFAYVGNSVVANCAQGVFVEQGGNLELTTDAEFSACQIGVATTGGTLSMDGAKFLDCTTGVNIIDAADITDFSNNLFFDNINGLFAFGVGNNLNLVARVDEPNTFDNCNTGINLFSSGATIQSNVFSNNSTSINLYQSSFVDIKQNEIGYNIYGIYASNNSNFRALGNEIGTLNDFGSYGVRSTSSITNIQENTIRAGRYPASIANCTNAQIYDNDIFAMGIGSGAAAGINWNRSEGLIGDNTIEISKDAYGIVLETTSETVVSHNSVDGVNSSTATKSGIFVSASTNATIDQNIVQGEFVNGIDIVNSNLSFIDCNEVNVSKHGILVNNNAAFHKIRGNSLTADTDLKLNSKVGKQRHHGNFWLGGFVDGGNLSVNDAVSSTFTVDHGINDDYWPESFDPHYLFRFSTDTQNETHVCLGEAGPKVFVKSEICDDFNELMQMDASRSNAYWINLYHLYNNLLATSTERDWPTCVLNWWNDGAQNCGIRDLLESTVNIKTAMKGSNPMFRMDLVSQIETILDSGNGAKQLNSLIGQLQEISEDDAVLLMNTLALELTNLDRMTCGHPLSNVWISTKKLVVKKMMNVAFTTAEIEALESTAELCSGEYGDVVQWSRSLLNEINDIDYAPFDVCSGGVRSKELLEKPVNDIAIYPNPVDANLMIEGIQDFDFVDIAIYNTLGSLIKTAKIYNGEEAMVDMSDFADGNYFVKIVSDNGVVMSSKILVLHP